MTTETKDGRSEYCKCAFHESYRPLLPHEPQELNAESIPEAVIRVRRVACIIPSPGTVPFSGVPRITCEFRDLLRASLLGNLTE
jgi:hypothetical protein